MKPRHYGLRSHHRAPEFGLDSAVMRSSGLDGDLALQPGQGISGGYRSLFTPL